MEKRPIHSRKSSLRRGVHVSKYGDLLNAPASKVYSKNDTSAQSTSQGLLIHNSCSDESICTLGGRVYYVLNKFDV